MVAISKWPVNVLASKGAKPLKEAWAALVPVSCMMVMLTSTRVLILLAVAASKSEH